MNKYIFHIALLVISMSTLLFPNKPSSDLFSKIRAEKQDSFIQQIIGLYSILMNPEHIQLEKELEAFQNIIKSIHTNMLTLPGMTEEKLEDCNTIILENMNPEIPTSEIIEHVIAQINTRYPTLQNPELQMALSQLIEQIQLALPVSSKIAPVYEAVQEQMSVIQKTKKELIAAGMKAEEVDAFEQHVTKMLFENMQKEIDAAQEAAQS